MIEQDYSINEILSAVEEIQNKVDIELNEAINYAEKSSFPKISISSYNHNAVLLNFENNWCSSLSNSFKRIGFSLSRNHT